MGTTEIAQLWDDNGTLALTVYRYEQGTMVAPVGNDLGQGTGAVAWLTGDFFGRGSTQIVQLWDNDGTLGAVVYGCVNGTAETLFGSSDLGQGSGAVAWLTGNFTPSGNLEIRNSGTTTEPSCVLLRPATATTTWSWTRSTPATWVRDRVPWPG